MKKINLKINILILISVCLFGCTPKIKKLLGQIPEPENQITIHQIVKYPRAKRIERDIPTFSGRTICININSFLHSKSIKKIELIPRGTNSKYYDLKLFLNRKGRLHWMTISNGFRGQHLGFVIDGIFYRSFIPKPMVGEYDTEDDSTYVVIDGPFDKGTADMLVEWAPKNYQFYNDQDDEY